MEYLNCPCCNKQLLIKTKKPEARSIAWCVGKDCGFSIPKMIFMKTLPKWAVDELMAGESTEIIDGFVSRSNYYFSACLKVDKAKKRVGLDLDRTDLYR